MITPARLVAIAVEIEESCFAALAVDQRVIAGRSELLADLVADADEIDLISISNQISKKFAATSDHTLVYRERGKAGLLYLNSNGDEPGWGNQGGELIRLKGAPVLNADHLFIS